MSRGTGKDGSQSQSAEVRRFHRVMDTYRALRRSELKVFHVGHHGAHRDSLDFCIDVEIKAKRCGVPAAILMEYAIDQDQCPVVIQEALGGAFVHVEQAYAKTFALVSRTGRFESNAEPVCKIATEEPETLEDGHFPSASDILEASTVPTSELQLEGEIYDSGEDDEHGNS